MSRKRPWQDEIPNRSMKRQSGGAQEDDAGDQEFERQLTVEILSCLLPPTESWRYDMVWRDVRVSLHKTLLVPFTLHRFGSSTTGLAFTGSDIDLCLEVLQPSPRPLLNAVQSALRFHRYLFTSVIALRGARVPIVKFQHLPSGVSGDISFSGTLSVRNTELIRLLCSMDARVKPLLALTKRWAKVQGLANTEDDKHRLSSYALIMMAVFYLQSRQILPPITALQARCPRKEFELGWECSFAPIPWTKLEPDAGMRDIVVGFFAFYAEFPFADDVICPLLGRPVPRSAFLMASTLPPEMAAYADRVVPVNKDTNKDTAAEQTNNEQTAGKTNKDPAADDETSADHANKNANTDPKNKLPSKNKMKQSVDQTNKESPGCETDELQSIDQTNKSPSANPKNKDASAKRTKKNSSADVTTKNPSATLTPKSKKTKTPTVGLSLANHAICLQDPFALDHNLVRGQVAGAFERFAKALAHAADVCKKNSSEGLLAELLTAIPTTKVICRRTIRREFLELPADRWLPAAMEVVQRILETVMALRLEPLPAAQAGAIWLACAAHHDVIVNRNAALSECKGIAGLSPVQLQARASARMRVLAGPSRAALARFDISLQPAPGPALSVVATGEEPGIKAANHFVAFLMSGLQKWVPAELRYLALTESLKDSSDSDQSQTSSPAAGDATPRKTKKKKKKKKVMTSQPESWLSLSEQAEMAKIRAIMAKVQRETADNKPIAARAETKKSVRNRAANEMTKVQPAATRVQNETATRQQTSARVLNEMTKVQPAATRVQNEMTKVQPAATWVQNEMTKVQPAATRVQNEMTKVHPTATRVKNEMTKVQPAATRVQNEMTKVQPAATRVQNDMKKVQPIAAKGQRDSAKIQPIAGQTLAADSQTVMFRAFPKIRHKSDWKRRCALSAGLGRL